MSSLKIILAPAKKMNEDPVAVLPFSDLPRFTEQAEEILAWLRARTHAELQKLWKCNDQIAALNFARLERMDLRRNLVPAVLSYEGLAFQYMAPAVFEESQLEYVQSHLRILSGFYGVLRPMDGVTPYRLEMQAKAAISGHKDLYDLWGSRLHDALMDDMPADDALSNAVLTDDMPADDMQADDMQADDMPMDDLSANDVPHPETTGDPDAFSRDASCEDRRNVIVNLASKEYSVCVEKYLTERDRYIDVNFCEMSGGRLITKGTHAKMARGEMVRYMAEHRIEDPEEMKHFDRLGYRFRCDLSDDTHYTFERLP